MQSGSACGSNGHSATTKLAGVEACSKISIDICFRIGAGRYVWFRFIFNFFILMLGPVTTPLHLLFLAAAAAPMRAVEGDIVTIHWVCINEDGEVLESSRASDEPTTFEVGAGDIVGNRLFEAFDEVVRGMSLGETVSIRVGPISLVLQLICLFFAQLGCSFF